MCVSCTKDTFNQPGYTVLKNIEDLLLKAANNDDYTPELEFVSAFYYDDFEQSSLKLQLELLITLFSNQEKATLKNVRDHFKSLSPAQRGCMSEVCTLLKLLMVVPATNAVSERSASGVRRVKTYLRSTMTQMRLNNLLVLHVHKDKTDNIKLECCLNEFVSLNDHRFSVFGKFCCCVFLKPCITP